MRSPLTICILALATLCAAQPKTLEQTYLTRLSELRSRTLAINPAGAEYLGHVIATMDNDVFFQPDGIVVRMNNGRRMANTPLPYSTVYVQRGTQLRNTQLAMQQASRVQMENEIARLGPAALPPQYRHMHDNTFSEAMMLNPELASLLYSAYLEPKYPFKLAKEQPFLEEMRFMGIKSHDKVVEADGYSANLATKLALTTDSVTLYKTHCSECNEAESQQKNALVRYVLVGDTTQTFIQNMPDDKLSQHIAHHAIDKAVVRLISNAQPFKKDVIVQTKAVLKQDGSFFVLIGKKRSAFPGHRPPSPISVKKVTKMMKKQGFTLVRRGEHGWSEMLEFRVGD